ncbi:YciI family protein [Shewanella nanhaiensis]|uniref:YciI family protein n=1 Tax=Shewanella nanhaiensis TaxID=2864872 RepID=A0ABS7E4N0_9GAMM|nr:YciI family protein [Shewanella nanhaiensis]MBW8184642.1 YciI family protein [Shewanella nanhaiensis]
MLVKIAIFLSLIFISTSSVANFDPHLAQKLGADEYGMKQYVMAFLKKGPNRDQTQTEAAALQRSHLDNITRLADEGLLVLAGPFMDDGEIRGIYIFNVKTVAQAQALTETDPSIKQGRLVMELHPWYGSAALMELNTRHKLVSKKPI